MAHPVQYFIRWELEEIIYLLFFNFAAVQHERGPRKPKLQPPTSSQSHHHHSPPLGHPGLPHLPPSSMAGGGDGKLASVSSGAFHFSHGVFSTTAPHHPLKALQLPPPPSAISNPQTHHLDTLPLPIFHPPALPPPPGLLHILMSAEKCQVSTENCFGFASGSMIEL